MTGSTVGSTPVQQMESLSELIIDTLRNISASRQPLNVATLSQALSRNSKLTKLFTSSDGDSHHRSDSPEDQIQALRAEITKAISQKEDASRQSGEFQRLAQETRTLMKRCLLALLTLTYTPSNKPFFPELNELRELAIQDAPTNALEDALSRLKDTVHRKDLEENGTENLPEPGFWGRFRRKKEASQEQPVRNDVHLKQFQDFFIDTLNHLDFDFNKEHLRGFADLSHRIEESADFNQLLVILDDFSSLMRIQRDIRMEERRQVTDFIAEISSGVFEMENHLLFSVNQSTQMLESDKKFTSLIEGQVDEIGDSFHMTQTLAEIKEVIHVKLSTIRQAIEDKRQEDLQRQEDTCRELGCLQENLKNMKCEIEQVQERSRALEIESLVDSLTEIPNRRAFDKRIKEELVRYHRYQQIFSLLLFDIDHFKNVNDRYGHKAGDKCLREVIRRIKPALRQADFLSRYGGEEFVVIVPGIERGDAANMADRLCRLVERTRFTYHTEQIPLTISIGVTQVDTEDRDQDTLFNRVDSAMYQAKKTGRNRVVSL